MNLAIKGHLSRGNEVIEILEMLGGINVDNLYGDDMYSYYYITDDKEIDSVLFKYSDDKARIFTLEDFLEKFPYKVGDKVIIKVKNQEAIIDKVVWCCDTIIYWLKYDGCLEGNWRAEHLQPYKEETMEEKIQAYEITGEICANEVAIEFDPSKFEMIERNGKYFVVKKQPQYPKTYEECCNVIGCDSKMVLGSMPVRYNTLVKLEKLLICRDAYWKIAGDEMGLGKPWKPVLGENFIYAIGTCYGTIAKRMVTGGSGILLFPTEEMRDAFYENFKDLIEQCKESKVLPLIGIVKITVLIIPFTISTITTRIKTMEGQ